MRALCPIQGGNAWFIQVNKIGGAENYGCRRKSQNYTQMRRMQAEKLQHGQEQEEYLGPFGAEQVLPILQKAHKAR